MKKVIIIGASFQQLPLVLKAKKYGYETHVFAWEEGAVAKEYANHFYPISITDIENIMINAKRIKPDGVCTIGSDLANTTVSFIANEFNLVGNSLNTTLYSTNKYEMRKVLYESKLPVPLFKCINSINEVHGFSYPFMVKAVDRSGSRGITLVNNYDEYYKAFEESLKHSFEDYIMIEEYFEGTQFSVETFSQNGKHSFIGLTEEFYTGAPYFVEEKHIMPGRIDESVKEKIVNTVFKALTVLNVQNGASHTEIRVNNRDELCIIEIATRMGGDFRYKLIELSNSLDYIDMVLQNSMGYHVEVPEVINKNGALIKYILNEQDYNCYKDLSKEIEIEQSEMIMDKFHTNIQDSSDRYGYFIIKGQSSQKCLDLLGKYYK